MFASKVIFTALLTVAAATAGSYAGLISRQGPVVICTCPDGSTTSGGAFVGYKCDYPTGTCVWNVVSTFRGVSVSIPDAKTFEREL